MPAKCQAPGRLQAQWWASDGLYELYLYSWNEILRGSRFTDVKASYDSYSSTLSFDIVFPFVCLFIHSFYQYTLWYMRMKCFEICKDDRQPARYADGTKMLFTIAYLKWSCQNILIVWYTLLSRIQTVSRFLLINLYLHYKPIRHCITISLELSASPYPFIQRWIWFWVTKYQYKHAKRFDYVYIA